jgi:hypothetical protein
VYLYGMACGLVRLVIERIGGVVDLCNIDFTAVVGAEEQRRGIS